jgi:hypothetical protein
MRFHDAIELLRRWFEKIRVAVWLHERELDGGRRMLMFGAAAVAASSLLATVPGYRTLADLVPRSDLLAELAAVTRRAFSSRLYVQLWQSPPLMALLANA